MLRILVIAFLVFLLYRVVKAVSGLGRPTQRRGANGEVIDEMVQDPQCGTYLPRQEAVRRRIAGEDHYFCSEKCAKEYEKARRGKT